MAWMALPSRIPASSRWRYASVTLAIASPGVAASRRSRVARTLSATSLISRRSCSQSSLVIAFLPLPVTCVRLRVHRVEHFLDRVRVGAELFLELAAEIGRHAQPAHPGGRAVHDRLHVLADLFPHPVFYFEHLPLRNKCGAIIL